jgi:lipoprotein-anchoring transpeptidase ErfK/SrfK
VARKDRAATLYYKALLLDYPNADDRRAFARARRAGEVSAGTGIGGLIEIHGEGGLGRDWTKGCVALTNADIDDLFQRVDVGTPVTIVGSDEPGGLAAIAAGRRSPAPDGGR